MTSQNDVKQRIGMLLDMWERSIQSSRSVSIRNAKRIYGSTDTYVQDKGTIVTNLEYAKIIDTIRQQIRCLIPDHPIMNDIMKDPVFVEKWKIIDYIDLYYDYYETLIVKIRRFCCE